MSTYLYEGRLLETPEITKSSPDEYWGIEELNDVTLKFDNHDGYFITKIVAEEIRNELVILKRWDENESGSNKLRFEQLGRISSYNITDVAEITVSSAVKDKLATLYPSKVYALTDFTESRPNIFNPPDDLGKPYPILFGRCEKVPCLYIHCNYTSDYYDYAIAYVGSGNSLKSCQAVYRDDVQVATGEYTFYDGSQTTPYPGYAFLRFVKEQRSFSGSMHQISADVYGLTLGGTDECRNFATVIENFLSNSYWGTGEAVNAASFTAAATILDAIGSYYCDGGITTQRSGRDILNDMLFPARGKLKLNDSGEWTITIDNTDNDKIAYFGSGEGVWENIIEVKGYYKTPVNEALKKVLLRYRYNESKGVFAYKYERYIFAFGEEKEYECNFVRDHTTAAKLICYLQKRAIYRDSHLNITVGMEGRFLDEMDLLDIQITRLQIEGDYKIRSITKSINKFDLELVSHNNLIYTYVADTLNIDPISGGPKDFQNPDSPDYEAPTAPRNITKVSETSFVTEDGRCMQMVVANAQQPAKTINFASIVFGYKKQSESKWSYVPGKLSSTPEWWEISLVLYPSTAYNVTAYSVNSFGIASDTIIMAFTTTKDTTPPAQVTGLTAKVKGNTWDFTWTANTESDLKNYRVHIDDSSGFGDQNIFYGFVDSTTVSYTNESLAYGTTLYCRVMAYDYSGNPSASWSATASATNSSYGSTDLAADSVGATLINADVAGTGLIQNGSTGALEVNPDGSTIETSADTFRVKDLGITEGKLATGAVTADKIGTGAITTIKIGDDQVTEGKIRFGTTQTSAGAGAATLPATPEGFIDVDIAGSTKRIPYYPTS